MDENIINSLFGDLSSLMFPTLFDLIVHSVPDKVLGDGGSMYLKIKIPENEEEKICEKCPDDKINDGKNTRCPYRVYEIATTRDYGRVEIGRGFYCTNPKCYEKAGEELEKLLDGYIIQVNNKIQEVIENNFNNMKKNNKETSKEYDIIDSIKFFLELFYSNNESDSSKITNAIKSALNNQFDDEKYSQKFEQDICNVIIKICCKYLKLYKELYGDEKSENKESKDKESKDNNLHSECKKYEKSGNKKSENKESKEKNLYKKRIEGFEKLFQEVEKWKNNIWKKIESNLEVKQNGSEPDLSIFLDSELSINYLFRYITALVASKNEDNQLNEQDNLNNLKKSIVWEIFRCHSLLENLYNNYIEGLKYIRLRFEKLGLSGWVAAFGEPIRLKSIENPFEIIDYPNDKNLPIPLWGDRARGHKDRLEREGRPFICIPILNNNEKDRKKNYGIIRVATKREGERYFTSDGKKDLEKYGELVAKLIEIHRIPINDGLTLEDSKGEPTHNKKKDEDKKIKEFWYSFMLYGAVKGKGIEELGEIAAKTFRNIFGVQAVSIFLREDLLQSPEKLIQKNDNTTHNKNDIKRRCYTLWGTDIDEELLKEEENKIIFSDFKNQIRSLTYQEGEGKTGWAVKYQAALLAYYQDAEIIISFPKIQVNAEVRKNEGAKNDNDTSTSNCIIKKIPSKIFTHDPLEIEKVIRAFSHKKETANKKCEIKTDQHTILFMVPLIDPDTSPEPLGVVRLIITKLPENNENNTEQIKDNENLSEVQVENAVNTYLIPVARFARSFSRLMRTSHTKRILFRTFTNLVKYSNESYEEDNPPKDVTESLEGGIIIAGPYGRVASSLIGLGEASALSIFVHNDYAPKRYRDSHSEFETWVLVGAAAASDALSPNDLNHFKTKYCKEFFKDYPGKCRYESGKGRTGIAIKNKATNNVGFISIEDHRSGEYTCEVQSPNALLIIPSVESNYENKRDAIKSKNEKDKKVVAVVRFVRTEERRRAKFLKQEEQQLKEVINTLYWLVPSWSEQNNLHEFKKIWRKESQSYFPLSLQKILKKELEINNQKISSLSRAIPNWFFSDKEKSPPFEPKEVIKNERKLLAWFLNALENPSPEESMTDIISKVVRAILRIHWGTEQSSVWIDKLDRLEKFEPVLSEIPHYRDHSIHQFQVFLIGWLLMLEFKKKGFDIEYNRTSKYKEKDSEKDKHKEKDSIKDKEKDEHKEKDENKEKDSIKDKEKNSEKEKDKIIDASSWVLTSIFHDVAYPLQHVYSWANLFGKALISSKNESSIGNKSIEFVKRGDAEIFLDKSSHSTFFSLPIDTLINGIFEILGSDSDERPNKWVKSVVKDVVDDRIKNWDHGVWAATVLLNSTDAKPSILNAAVAIALHNGLIFDLNNRLKGGQKNILKLEKENTSLTFLLMLSDAIHEWGRHIWKNTTGSDHINDFIKRPELKSLQIENNKDKEIIKVDIALGSQANESSIHRKVQEFKMLSEILDPGCLNFKIRVCREEPDKLSILAEGIYSIDIFPHKKIIN